MSHENQTHATDQAATTAADHRPLYWFSRLVQAVANRNEHRKYEAQFELRRLGFDVHPIPPMVSP